VKAVICALTIVGILALPVFAVGSGPEDFFTRGDDGEIIWHFNDYLHGTTDQVVQQLNKDVVRLQDLIKQAQADIDQLKNDITTEQAASDEKVKKTQQYADLLADMNEADAERKTATGQDKLDASSRFNKDRFAILKLEHDAEELNSTLVDDRRFLAQHQQELKGHQTSLQGAIKWRRDLLKVLGDSFSMEWPIRPGTVGFIPTVQVKEMKNGKMACEYLAPEAGSDQVVAQKEGYTETKVMAREVMLIMDLVDGAKVGQTLTLNKTFRIDEIHEDDSGVVFCRATPAPGEADTLFARVNIPEIDSLPAPAAPGAGHGPSK
jgi:hypothetical protein